MSENINEEQPLSNELAALAEDVKRALAEADDHERQMAERTLDAGHMLLKAKEAGKHGDWLPFLTRAGINERKAQRLMKLARHGFKSDIVSLLGGVAPALRHASRPMPGPGKALCVSTSDDNSISVVFVAASDKHPGFYNIVGVTQNADGTLETQLLKRPILGEWTGSGLNWVGFLSVTGSAQTT